MRFFKLCIPTSLDGLIDIFLNPSGDIRRCLYANIIFGSQETKVRSGSEHLQD